MIRLFYKIILEIQGKKSTYLPHRDVVKIELVNTCKTLTTGLHI